MSRLQNRPRLRKTSRSSPGAERFRASPVAPYADLVHADCIYADRANSRFINNTNGDDLITGAQR